jgi:hypothetical protein
MVTVRVLFGAISLTGRERRRTLVPRDVPPDRFSRSHRSWWGGGVARTTGAAARPAPQ